MKNQVIQSLETPDGDRCVDLFKRPDGTFGFEIYRRDTEALTGWFAIGVNIERSFATDQLALEAAAQLAPWIKS